MTDSSTASATVNRPLGLKDRRMASADSSIYISANLKSGPAFTLEVGMAHGVGHGSVHPFLRLALNDASGNLDRIYTISLANESPVLNINDDEGQISSEVWQKRFVSGSSTQHSTAEHELILGVVESWAHSIENSLHRRRSLPGLTREDIRDITLFINQNFGLTIGPKETGRFSPQP